MDYSCLNFITKIDVFLLPRIVESVDILANGKYFLTLDLRSGYWQIRMALESVKTVFTTHSGLYEFVAMLLGLRNALSTFQWLMERQGRRHHSGWSGFHLTTFC